MKPLILINGPKRSGKTTVAKALQKYGWKVLDLNAPFKEFVLNSLGVDEDMYESLKDTVMSPHEKTIRELMIETANVLESSWSPVWIHNAMKGRNLSGGYIIDSLGKQAQMNYLDAIGADSVVLRVSRNPADHERVTWGDGRETVIPASGNIIEIKNWYGFGHLDKEVINAVARIDAGIHGQSERAV